MKAICFDIHYMYIHVYSNLIVLRFEIALHEKKKNLGYAILAQVDVYMYNEEIRGFLNWLLTGYVSSHGSSSSVRHVYTRICEWS